VRVDLSGSIVARRAAGSHKRGAQAGEGDPPGAVTRAFPIWLHIAASTVMRTLHLGGENRLSPQPTLKRPNI